MPVFERHSTMPCPVDELFAYYVRPRAFERLMPPWERFRVVEQTDGMRDGGRLVFDAGPGPFKLRWVAEMSGYVEGRQFTDRQTVGPFALWEHTHRFLPRGDDQSELIDHVEYRLPAGWVADLIASGAVTRQLERLFRFRHARTRNDLERHAMWAGQRRLKVAIAGASGLIGSHLAVYLMTAGHDVVRLVRRPVAQADEIAWYPDAGRLDPSDLHGVDAVVNLAGVSLASIWTKSRKEAILRSRVQATQTLVTAIAHMETPPAVLVSASAIGAYGPTSGEALTEEGALGTGFLADVCREWEAAAAPAAAAGVRVVTPRFGIVLTASGGALAAMLPVFRAGLGGRVGEGWQWWSWVALDDLLGALEWAIHDRALDGVVNVVSPEAVTNREFTRTLGRVLRRPAVLEAPRGIVEKFGGMPKEMLLASQRVVPMRLRERGFPFAFPGLEQALRYELGR